MYLLFLKVLLKNCETLLRGAKFLLGEQTRASKMEENSLRWLKSKLGIVDK